MLAWLEEKIASVTLIPVSHGESFNVLHYNLNQKYDSHMDTFDPKVSSQRGEGLVDRCLGLIEVDVSVCVWHLQLEARACHHCCMGGCKHSITLGLPWVPRVCSASCRRGLIACGPGVGIRSEKGSAGLCCCKHALKAKGTSASGRRFVGVLRALQLLVHCRKQLRTVPAS